MSVESPSYGLSHWPLPSPSATPKSCVSQQRQFESPSAESPSFFADAYYTPSVKGQQTPALTPVSTSTAILHSRSIKNSPLSPHDPKFHKNIYATSTLPLPPVDPSKRLSSSPNPQDENSRFAQEGLQVDLVGFKKMDPYHLHTPPPGEGPRHPHMQHPHTVHGHPFGQGHDNTNTPIRQQSMNFNGHNLQTPTYQTPFQNNISLSTDMYQYQNGPASAPPVPQARFMWDQSPQMGGFEPRMMPVNQPQFGTPNSMMGHWQTQELSPHNVQGSFPQPSSNGLPNPGHDTDFWLSSSMASQPTGNAFTSDAAFMQPTSGVNPNLLFSFSSPVQTVNPSSVGTLFAPPVIDSASRQPYEQQNRASTQEKELAKKTRQTQQQPPLARAGATLAPNSRPSLQRSNTDSGFRRNKTRSVDSRTAVQLGESISRRESPLKRHSQISLKSIPEATSRSSKLRTRLVIDASGTARTETVLGGDDNTWNRRRSSHLLDDDSSEEDPIFTSQRNSFVFNPDLLRPSKHGRNDSDDEDGGLYKRPLSTASLSSLTARLGSTPLGRKVPMDAHRRASQDYASFLGDLASSSQDTILVNDDDSDTGDAQSALKKLVGGRARRDFCDPNATIKPRRAATNPVRSTTMMDITKFPSPPSPPTMFDRPSSTNTPTTDRSTRSADSTRCVCGVNGDSGNSRVVQCESCTNFLHVRCVFGKRAEERGVPLPRGYVCAYCTGQTRQPNASLGTGHFQGQDNVFGTSPLGYKSGSFMG